MLNLDELLDAVPERTPETLVTETAQVFLSNKLVTFRFTEMPTKDWARCTLSCPPRAGVTLDQSLSYDVTAATELAAPINGVLVDGDDIVTPTPGQWVRIFASIDTQGRQAITDAVFVVNEHAHIKRIEAAKKALEGASKKKPRSPSN